MHCREGFGQEGGVVASSSYRFLFEYDGQEYVWTKKRTFAGDTLSCQNLSTGNHVARYIHKILPPKLQGVLTVEPTVRPASRTVQVALVMHSCTLDIYVPQLLNATHQGKAHGRSLSVAFAVALLATLLPPLQAQTLRYISCIIANQSSRAL